MTDLSGLDRLDEPAPAPRSALRKPWVWILAVVVLGIGAWYFLFGAGGGGQEAETPRRSATIGHRTLGDVVTASGTLKPSRLVEVAPRSPASSRSCT